MLHLNGLFMHTPKDCVLLAVPERAFIRIASFIRSPSLTDSVCCAVQNIIKQNLSSKTRVFLIKQNISDCFLIHLIRAFLSQQLFCWNFTINCLTKQWWYPILAYSIRVQALLMAEVFLASSITFLIISQNFVNATKFTIVLYTIPEERTNFNKSGHWC